MALARGSRSRGFWDGEEQRKRPWPRVEDLVSQFQHWLDEPNTCQAYWPNLLLPIIEATQGCFVLFFFCLFVLEKNSFVSLNPLPLPIKLALEIVNKVYEQVLLVKIEATQRPFKAEVTWQQCNDSCSCFFHLSVHFRNCPPALPKRHKGDGVASDKLCNKSLFRIMSHAVKRNAIRELFSSLAVITQSPSACTLCHLYTPLTLAPSGPSSHSSNYENRMLSEPLSFWKVADKRRIRGPNNGQD